MQERMQGAHVSVPARRILGCGDSEQQLFGGAVDVQLQTPESQLLQLGSPTRRLLMVPSRARKAWVWRMAIQSPALLSLTHRDTKR